MFIELELDPNLGTSAGAYGLKLHPGLPISFHYSLLFFF